MESYSPLDYINADIRIREINAVYTQNTDAWSRPKPFPRDYDGILVFISGGIKYDFGSFTFRAEQGQVLKLPANIPYCGKKLGNGPNFFYCVDFTTEEQDTFLNYPIPLSFTPSDLQTVIQSFKEIYREWNRHSICYQMNCRAELTRLLAMLAKDYAVHGCGYNDQNHILQMSDYININVQNPDFRVSEVAEKFHVSESHLRRLFQKFFGVSPVCYLQDLRLAKAKEYLRMTDISIAEIAFLCGYTSPSYFSDAFRTGTGMSPSQYREK